MATDLTPAQRLVAAHMSEAALQRNIVALARALGYLVAHARDSRGQPGEGEPDLRLVPPVGSGLRVLWIELKKEGENLTTTRLIKAGLHSRVATGQEEWRDRLVAAGQRWCLFKPTDWLSGRVERVLRGGTM